jgi:Rv0078B-related antitoxin
VTNCGERANLLIMSDTSAEAAQVQARIQRRLSGVERLRIAIDMSDLARRLLRARLQQDHPEWDDARLLHAMLPSTFAEFRSPGR